MDLDGDGRLDILSGSYSRVGGQSMAGLFQVLRGNAEGGFGKAEPLTGTDKEPLIIPVRQGQDKITRAICTRPIAVDWDVDGDLDLVVGNFEGSFYLFRGTGEGGFNPLPERLKCGEEDLRISGAHSDPFAVDWDGDGDLDLLSGSSEGGVEWSENSAGKGVEPRLRPFKRLIEAPGQGVTVKDAPSDSTRVWVDDVDGDGKLDLLVGDKAVVHHPVGGLSEKEMTEKKLAWQEKTDALMAEIRKARATEGLGADKELMSEYRELYNSRVNFMREERTGYVWLYLQK